MTETMDVAAAPLRLFLLAGEMSGDALGARLMTSLKARSPVPVRFTGVGGPLMAGEGLHSLFPMEDIAHFGAAELLPHLPTILRRMRQTTAAVLGQRPDAMVTIDVPGFALRVGKRLRGRGVPLIHYVAPQVWAWKPHRAAEVAGFLDHMLALLPFEPPYFEAEGLPCTYVGHPVIESGADAGDGPAFRARHGIAGDVPLLCVLPGSRRIEMDRLLGVFSGAVARLAAGHPRLHAVVPAADALHDDLSAAVARWPVPAVVVRGAAERFDAFAAADAAMAASGTVALELALAGTPTVICYRLNPITGWLVRRAIRVKRVSLVNLLADDEVFPELLQGACTAPAVAASVGRLLDDVDARARQRAGMDRAVAVLRSAGDHPSDRAAEVVLDVAMREHARRVTHATALSV